MKIKLLLFTAVFLITSVTVNAQDQGNEEETSFLVIEKVPIYPGCKGDRKKLMSCFNTNIQKLFIDNFDLDLANNLGLAGGKYRVYIGFTISRKGNVKNVAVRAPHQKIKEEVKRVMYLIPSMIPGEAKGKKVNVKYSIPFTMEVEETKDQKRERKKREKELRKN